MWTLVVITMIVWFIDSKGIRLHLSGINNNRHEDCADIKMHRPLSRDRMYTIYPTAGTKKTVFCDMTTDGRGWTVIQRRQDGDTDFLRKWKDYKNGFGHAEDDYWLGNDTSHALTKDKKQVLMTYLKTFSREKGHLAYSSFFVDNEANEYKLSLWGGGGFNGTKGLGDSFGHSNNAYFSTVDVDNDNNREDCEGTHKAGWWFNSCIYANLNGVYIKASKKDGTELSWKSLKSAKMMIRPRQNALNKEKSKLIKLDNDAIVVSVINVTIYSRK